MYNKTYIILFQDNVLHILTLISIQCYLIKSNTNKHKQIRSAFCFVDILDSYYGFFFSLSLNLQIILVTKDILVD